MNKTKTNKQKLLSWRLHSSQGSPNNKTNISDGRKKYRENINQGRIQSVGELRELQFLIVCAKKVSWSLTEKMTFE